MKYIMKYKTKKKIVFLLIFLFLGIIIMNSVVRKEGLSVGSATATAVNPTPPPRPTTKAGCQRAHPDWIPDYVFFLKTKPDVDTTNMCNNLLRGKWWFQKDYPGKPGELNHTCCGK